MKMYEFNLNDDDDSQHGDTLCTFGPESKERFWRMEDGRARYVFTNLNHHLATKFAEAGTVSLKIVEVPESTIEEYSKMAEEYRANLMAAATKTPAPAQ